MSKKDKDYYKILNIEKNATDDEIRKSYKKLALQYHPDKNNGCTDDEKNKCIEKFKEVSEAYSILSDKDKRSQYDTFGSGGGDMFDFGEDGIDPFSKFNDIFQQHMSNFMNMRYENNIDINEMLGSIGGGNSHSFPMGNIHFKIHTFKKNEFVNDFPTEDERDYNNPLGGINGLGGIFENIFSKVSDTGFSKQNNNKNKTKVETKIIYNKPEPIIYDIKVSFEDIYNNVKKTITIKRNKILNKGNPEYIKKVKKIDIPIYGKEVFLENMGNEEVDFQNRGDVIINIYNKKHKKFKRVNEYDMLTFKDITLNDFYGAFTYDLVMPHGEVLLIQAENMTEMESNKNGKILLQKILNKGLPYKTDDDNDLCGNLYVMYRMKLPKTVDELKDIKLCENTESIAENYLIAYNCDIDEILCD